MMVFNTENVIDMISKHYNDKINIWKCSQICAIPGFISARCIHLKDINIRNVSFFFISVLVIYL